MIGSKCLKIYLIFGFGGWLQLIWPWILLCPCVWSLWICHCSFVHSVYTWPAICTPLFNYVAPVQSGLSRGLVDLLRILLNYPSQKRYTKLCIEEASNGSAQLVMFQEVWFLWQNIVHICLSCITILWKIPTNANGGPCSPSPPILPST